MLSSRGPEGLGFHYSGKSLGARLAWSFARRGFSWTCWEESVDSARWLAGLVLAGWREDKKGGCASRKWMLS